MAISEKRRDSGRVLFCVGSGHAREGAGLYGHTEGKYALLVGPSVIANIICMSQKCESIKSNKDV